MNKTDFARSLAKANGITYKQGAEIVDMFLGHLETVVPELESGEALNLTGYVKFTVKDTVEREARNPQDGSTVIVPAGRSVRASIGSTLKKAVKGA